MPATQRNGKSSSTTKESRPHTTDVLTLQHTATEEVTSHPREQHPVDAEKVIVHATHCYRESNSTPAKVTLHPREQHPVDAGKVTVHATH